MNCTSRRRGPRCVLAALLTISAGAVCPSPCVRGLGSRSSNSLQGRAALRMADGPLAGLDPEQVRMMEERIIVVDRGDRILRPESKVNAHLNEHGPMLHRAFSVFIFDDEGRLLLQQRAPEKVTFPSCWTNTCCSHPLYTPDELGEGDGGFLDGAVTGCARAAIRKLEHELGIRTNTFAPEDLLFLTRIHYLARAAADSPDERVEFGEHEIDYLFVARVPAGGMLMVPNANEVSATRFVDEAGMRKMLAQARKGELRLTPWFEMIAEEFLFRWWTDLHDRPKLLAHRDVDSIFRFGECAAEPMQVEPPESNSVVS